MVEHEHMMVIIAVGLFAVVVLVLAFFHKNKHSIKESHGGGGGGGHGGGGFHGGGGGHFAGHGGSGRFPGRQWGPWNGGGGGSNWWWGNWWPYDYYPGYYIGAPWIFIGGPYDGKVCYANSLEDFYACYPAVSSWADDSPNWQNIRPYLK
jgi:hypothetical protein